MSTDTRTTPVLNATLIYDLKLVSFAIVALMLYDTCLNLLREVPYVWSRKPNVIGALYAVIRYGGIMVAIVDISIVYQKEDQSCNIMVHADNILRLVVYTGGAVFLALRAYALSGGRYILTIPVFLLNTSFISPNIYMLSKLHARVLPAFIGCQSILSWDTDFLVLSTLIRVSRTAIILSEVIVVALTWSKTRRTLRKASPHMSQSGASTLPAVLLRNGILCFVLPIVMTSIVWALDEKSSQRITAEVVEYIGQARDALNSIVTSRFLLDLSELAARVEASAGSSPMSLGVPTLTGYLTPGLSEVPSVLFEDNVDEPVRMAHEV